MISWHKVGQHVETVGGNDAVRAYAKNVGAWFPPMNSEQVISAVRLPSPLLLLVGSEPKSVAEFQLVGQLQPQHWYGSDLFRPIYPQAVEELRKLTSPSPQNAEELRRADERREVDEYLKARYSEVPS